MKLSLFLVACAALWTVDGKSAKRMVIEKLYDLTVYPNNMPFITTGVIPPGIFTPDVIGRVSPVIVLKEERENMEYFPGISPVQGPLMITDAKLTYYAEQGDVVATSVDTIYNFTASGNKLPLTTMGFWRFRGDLIEQYDLVALNLGEWTLASGNDYRESTIQAFLIDATCEAYKSCQRKHDPKGFYTDKQDCINHLSSIPFGTPDKSWSNTAYCRFVHSMMVPIDPALHCPHAGKTGGGACVDSSYYSFYDLQFYNSFDADV